MAASKSDALFHNWMEKSRKTTEEVYREYKTRHRHEEHTIWRSDGKKNLFGYIRSEHLLLWITQIGEFVVCG